MATTTKATMSMYSLKSYQKDVFVELPTNMYKTKSYHACPQQVGKFKFRLSNSLIFSLT